MKSITLHKLDPVLARALEERARSKGLSLNRTSQELLRSALGLDLGSVPDHTEAFGDLFGSWSREDLTEFNQRVADLERTDPADWES